MKKDNLLITLFIQIVGAILLIVAIFGLIAPMLISSRSTLMVVEGIVVCILSIPVLYFLIINIINNVKKVSNEEF